MKKMSWFRMYGEAVDDEKLRLLAFEDRWHFVALMCCKSSGIIDKNDPLLLRKLAVKLGLDVRTLEEVGRRLQEVGLINEHFEIINWEKRQFESDSSAARVAAYRERQKQQAVDDVTNCNVTVTPPDTDTDTDTEVKKDKPKGLSKEKKSRAVLLPDNFTISDNVKSWYESKKFTEPINVHYESFVEKCKAKGYKYLDWDAAFRNAISDDWAKTRVINHAKHGSTGNTNRREHADRIGAHLDKLIEQEFGTGVDIGAF